MMKALRTAGNGLIALSILLGLLAFAYGSPGCAHATPAQEQALNTAADLASCNVRKILTCIPAGDWTAYKDCLSAEELVCLKERQLPLIAAAGGLLFETIGVHLAGRVTVAPDAFAAEALCMKSIDAKRVVADCPPGKADRLCVNDAVQWCADHGAESGLGEGEGPKG